MCNVYDFENSNGLIGCTTGTNAGELCPNTESWKENKMKISHWMLLSGFKMIHGAQNYTFSETLTLIGKPVESFTNEVSQVSFH